MSRPLSHDDLDDLLVDELLRRRRLDDATAIHKSIRRALRAVRRCLEQHPAWDDDDQDLETIDERLQEAVNDAHRLVRRVKATRR